MPIHTCIYDSIDTLEEAIATNTLVNPYIALYGNRNNYNIKYSLDNSNTSNSIPLTFEILSPGDIVYKKDPNATSRTIEYSIDNGENWEELIPTEEGTHVSVLRGQRILFRGNNRGYCDYSIGGCNFSDSTCTFLLKGNIMSLINSLSYELLTISSEYAFASMFKNCIGLINIDNLLLPATTLKGHDYNSMFAGCTNLISAEINLPALSVNSRSYINMFGGCTSLISGPAILPARSGSTYCYESMFENCTSLTKMPRICLQTLSNHMCYKMFKNCTSLNSVKSIGEYTTPYEADASFREMFYGCTNLTIAPEFHITFSHNCGSALRNMFSNCTNLENAANIYIATECGGTRHFDNMFSGCRKLKYKPNVVLNYITYYDCYRMFYNCSSLPEGIDILAENISGQSGCEGMYQGCSALNNIKCLATSLSGDTCVKNWVNGVAASGTFIKAASMNDWPTGVSGIPSGWNIQNI